MPTIPEVETNPYTAIANEVFASDPPPSSQPVEVDITQKQIEAVNPYTAIAEEIFPLTPSPLESVYRDSASGDPAQSAKIINLANKTGQPDEFVAANLEDAEVAARVPDSDFFSVIQQSAPVTSQSFSDPRIMAAAHDDIQNAADHEDKVRRYSLVGGWARAANYGIAGFNAQLAAIPGLAGMRFGDSAVKFWLEEQQLYSTDELKKSPSALITEGNVSEVPNVVAHQVLGTLPSVILPTVAAGVSAASTPILAFMGILSAAGKYNSNMAAGVEQKTALLNAYYTGTFEAGSELIHVRAINTWASALTKSFGKDTARQVIKNVAKAFAANFSAEAIEEAGNAALSNVTDTLMGVRPWMGMAEFSKQVADAAIIGGAAGLAAGGPASVYIGARSARANAAQAEQTQLTKEFFLGFGESAEASKLRERLGPEYRKMVETMTKNGPVENVLVTREKLEVLLQESGEDIPKTMGDLGATDSYRESLSTGEPVKIKLSEMTKLIDSGIYTKLADDIKLRPEDLTNNERQERVDQELAAAAVSTEQAVAAVAPELKKSADIQAGYEKVLNQITQVRGAIPKPIGLTDAEYKQLVKRDATIAASMIVTRAVREKITVEESLALGPEIVEGEAGPVRLEAQTPEGPQAAETLAPTQRAPAPSSQPLDLSINPGITDVKAQAQDWLGREAAARGVPVTDKFIAQFAARVHEQVNSLMSQIGAELKVLPADQKNAFIDNLEKHPLQKEAREATEKFKSLQAAYPEIMARIPKGAEETKAFLADFPPIQEPLEQATAPARRVSIGLKAGAGTGLEAQGEIQPAEALRLANVAAEASGVEIQAVLTAGGAYLGEKEGSVQIDILGSPKAMSDFAAVMGYALKQTEVLVSRPLASGKSRGYTIIEDQGGHLGSKDGAETFVNRVRELVAEQQKAAAGKKKFEPWTIGSGYQMLVVDGKPALRFLHGTWDDKAGRVNWSGNWNAKEREAFERAVEQASVEFGIDSSAHIDAYDIQSEFNDWTKNPEGSGYRESLLARGRTELAGRLASDPELRLLPDAFGPPSGQVALEQASPSIEFTPYPGLTESQRAAESEFGIILARPDAFEKYSAIPKARGGKLLDADLLRELSPDYKRNTTAHTLSTQKPASAQIERWFQDALKKPVTGIAMFMGGGGGSGKTTALNGPLIETAKESDVILDTPMATEKQAVARIEAALESGRDVVYSYVFTPVVRSAKNVVIRFDDTGRYIPSPILAKDHVGAQETFLALVEKYKDNPRVEFFPIDGSTGAAIPTTIDKIVTARYTKSGQSPQEAIKELLPEVQEVMRDVERRAAEEIAREEAEFGRDRSRNRGGVGGEPQRSSQGSGEEEGQVAQQPAGGGGRIVRGAFYPSTNTLALFQHHNQTTFIHEMSHAWLKHAFLFARSGKADAAYLADWTKLSSHFGISDGQLDLTKAQQELFARSIEAYFLEGKAPTEELQSVFSKVKRWFLDIYGNLAGLEADAGVQITLSPEVRALMDRIFATDEQIAAASAAVGYQPEEVAGLDPKSAEMLRNLQLKARSLAEQQLLKDAMVGQLGERAVFMAAQTDQIRAEVEASISSNPLVVAMDDIQERLGKSAPSEWASRFQKGNLSADQESEFLVAAELAGMSGDELADAFILSQTKQQIIDTAVKARVDALDTPDRAKMREDALEAIHSEQSAELLALERAILGDLILKREISEEVSARRRIEARIEASAIKVQAQAILAKKNIRDASAFRVFYTAERNAAQRVSKAIAKGDLAAATEAKKQQLLNHILASESIKTRNEVARAQRFLAPFERRSDLMGMPYGFVSQIDALLVARGMADPRPQEEVTMLAIARGMAAKGELPDAISNTTGLMVGPDGRWMPEPLAALVSRINDDYHAITLPDSVFSQRPSQIDAMTIMELRELRDSVKILSEIGRKHERFLSAFITADMKTAGKELRTSIEKLVGTPRADDRRLGSQYSSELAKKVESISRLPDSATPLMVNLLTLAQFLDGGESDGPAHRLLYRVMKDAENEKIKRMEQTMEAVNGLFAKRYQPKELAAYKTKQYQFDFLVNADGTKRYISHEAILSILLNWGNNGNRDRIRAGFGEQVGEHFVPMSDENIDKMLDVLNKKDFDFAQDVWNHLQTYWPDIVKLEMLAKGVQPEPVKAEPIISKHGTYAGGYYPIAYDFEKSADAALNEDERNALYKQFSTAAAHTDSGHTINHVAGGVRRPVRLSLDVLFNHLENVVHDLSFRPAVIDMSRFLKQRDVKLAIENAVGIPGFRSILNSLKAVASDQGEHNGFWDSQIKSFRSAFTTAVLGVRLIRFVPDLAVNLSNTVWEMGPSDTRKAIMNFARSPVESKTFVDGKSAMMRNRQKLIDRDIYDISRKWEGRQSAIAQYAFVIQSTADQVLSYPMWLEVYNHNLAEKGERVATQIADEAVIRSFGSGSEIDRVGVQRGGEKQKILSMFYSWNSMMFNRLWLEGKLGGLAYNEGNVGAVISHAAQAAVMGILLPGIMEALILESLRNAKGEDKEGRKKRIASRILQQPFGYVWLVRDIAGFAIDKAITGRASFKLSPIESAVETLLSPVAEGANIAFTRGKHFDQKFAEKTARSAASVAGVPQLANDVFFNYVDWMKGRGEWTWRDFLSRRKKK